MMVQVQRFVRVCLVVCCLFGACLADTSESPPALDPGLFYSHPLTDMPGKMEDVKVKCVLPNHGTKLIPAGEVVDVLVGIQNGSPEMLNVTAAMGSINFPQNFSFYVQNFSLYQYHQVVAPQQSLSLLYQVRSDPNLYARDWIFAFTLFYHSNGVQYSNTFFNESVTVVEPDRAIDFEMLFMYVVLLGLLAIGGFFAYQAIKDKPLVKKMTTSTTKKVKKTEGETGAADSDQWLAGTTYAKDLKKRTSKKSPATTKTKPDQQQQQ
eukprot:TRINITY_DN4107_c0_g1_i4.p2 TRINITY_DN4107_c0_g1~~TRINITY_DN4107_c0_g1_i4.p2  ORF type:complete len:265 (-),score=31.88 TRINITY_DN4107_c0_g1_i4:419-1213(-)